MCVWAPCFRITAPGPSRTPKMWIREPGVTAPPGRAVPPEFDGQSFALARRHGDIEITRVGGDAFHRAALAPKIPAYDAHAGAVVIDDFRNFGGFDVLISWRRHFQRRRQVRP